jgi:glycerophosphoryl diester phosphodiesterase
MSGLDWLIARPIAHRGLHDAAAGIIENTASAFTAAIAAGYGIETDLQISADGEAMVYHDDALGRLTEGSGALVGMSAASIKQVRFKATADRILTLGELCGLVAGQVPLLLELKSRFDGDLRLAPRVATLLSGYAGAVAAMSFDPALIEAVRHAAPRVARGMVTQRHYPGHEWDPLTSWDRASLAFLLHAWRTRPNFIAYSLTDLPALTPLIARNVFRLPLLTWTVRSEDDRRRAMRFADQIIFERFQPR